MRRRYLALDVGGTKIQAGVVTGGGRVLVVSEVPARPQCTIAELLADIGAALKPLLGGGPAGLGMGFPALGDYQAGVLHGDRSLYPCVGGFPLRDHLAAEYGLPVRMTTDANMFVAGVARFGEGRGSRAILGLTLGSGLGVGLIVGGRLDEGSRGVPDSVLALLQASDQPLGAAGHHFERLYGAGGETLGARALAGDAAARQAFSGVGSSLATTVLRLLPVLPSLDAVVVGGGIARSWRFISPAVRRGLSGVGLRVVRTRLHYPALTGGAALFEPGAAVTPVAVRVLEAL